jgi:hypothetical protein
MEINSICYYVVKARTVLTNQDTGEIEFRTVERKFENEKPILAREQAFQFRNEFIYGMLNSIGMSDKEIGWNETERRIERLSEREIRKILNPFFDHEIIDEWRNDGDHFAPDDSLSWYPHYKTGIWIIFHVLDESYVESLDLLEGQEQIVVDKITRYNEPLPTPPNYTFLEEELAFYNKHDLDVKHYETDIIFFDDEAYLDGGNSDEESIVNISYLKTPFDWSGYDKKDWWKTIDEINQEELLIKLTEELNSKKTIYDAYIKGESERVEFKPSLINWSKSIRNIELEIAKTLCGFSNSNGGLLYIGFSDSGQVLGIDFKYISKDKFKREFTRIKTYYLPQSIAHTIYGDFYVIDSKEIFVITVYPYSEPVFLKTKDEKDRFIKEFYVRSDAATRQIYDIEEMYKYCINKWHKKYE